MVIGWGEGPNMFLESCPKGPCQLTYVLFFIVSMGTLKPVDYSTYQGHLIIGDHHEAPDGIVPIKMYLDSHLTMYILKTFARHLYIGDHKVGVAVFVVVPLTNHLGKKRTTLGNSS